MTDAPLARVNTVGILGIDAHPVTVECMRARGLPGLRVIGLPDTAVREAGDRVRAAIQHSALTWPRDRIVMNLAPAALPKAGSGFDLAMALSVLAVTSQLPRQALDHVIVLGELGLDASVQPSEGALVAARWIADGSHERGTRLIVPRAVAADIAWIDGIQVVAVATLAEAVEVLRGTVRPITVVPTPRSRSHPSTELADVRGQQMPRRAIEIAAAGGHHILLSGPYGSGKSMLAHRLRDVLPDLSVAESLDVAAIRSVTGERRDATTLDTTPPLREVHHTITASALIGGGSGMPRPGELSRAHHGVLLLDELLEFRRSVLDTLRQPLERGMVTVSRARGQVVFPCRVQLVATTNSCPCGRRGDPRHDCACREDQAQQYWRRLSGPLHDRIDLHVPMRPVDAGATATGGASTAEVAKQVAAARDFAACRDPHGVLSRDANWPALRLCADSRALRTLEAAASALAFSARAQVRVLAVARTIADLARLQLIQPDHVEEAVAFRMSTIEARR